MNAMLPLFAADTKSDKAANIVAVGRALTPHLGRARPLDRKLVSNTMTLMFGGTDAEGLWTWRDAYDAIEVALVLQLRRLAPQISRVEDAPADIASMLAGLTDLTLTHTRRSEEQVELDQFSTPPALGVIAVAAAQIRPGDRVLEPSAGTGLLAVLAEACGAVVELNEFSDHRAAILDNVFGVASRTRHDAAYLPDLIPSSGSFHAVVSNPPFQYLVEHLTASMKTLAEGGRLSAIVPTSLFTNSQAIASLTAHGSIVAAIAFPDRAFAKHGTSVDTGLIVVDRLAGGASWDGVITVTETLADAAKAAVAITPRPTAKLRAFRTVAASSLLAPRARALAGPAGKLAFLASVAQVEYQTKEWTGEGQDVGLYQSYNLARISLPKSVNHPSALVESAAMASVPPPLATYRPVLPTSLLERAFVSDAQMETVIYAGGAHSRMLPGWWKTGEAPHDVSLVPEGTEGAVQHRCGYFVGDGTGVGKGTEAAAVIADNMAQGRTRAVWLSKNDPLIEDARRDWRAIGGANSDISPQSAWKQGEAIKMDRGILFTTYATLRQPARGDRQSRLQQLVAYLGADFDGVIIFDEAHGMGNAAGGGKGARGTKKASLQGQAGLALQNLLPNARVLYVSATGATTPENLAYASRLGLWGGPEAPFNTREEFMSACASGGVAIMELVARELKLMGLYTARSLSFDGVEYEPLMHELTPQDIEIWDNWADAFQIIHKNLRAALESVGVTEDGKALSGLAVSAAFSAFQSNAQRFFLALLSGMKAPTVIKAVRNSVETGHSAVLQVVSTNEAVMERRLAEIPPEEWNNLSIDLTPKDFVLDYLMGAFPITRMKAVADDNDNVTLVPLMEDGAPVICQEALALRDELVTNLACLPGVPSILDAIMDAFGTDNVAEVTGRARRVVLHKNGRRVVERRGSSAAKSETDAFMTGKKKILIFSDAGGTGRSYHADLANINQERRHHYLIEPGWRADAAIQGLGRTHRSNQAVAPLFRPVTTDVQGEKRFLSTISRRLDSLGALSKGERRAAGNGLFKAEDNLESPWARQALQVFFSNMVWGNSKCMKSEEFEDKTALNLSDSNGVPKKSDEMPPMNTFLNRVLALRIADQNAIFADFTEILTSILEKAAASGALDRGMEDIRGDAVVIKSEDVLRNDPITGAQTKIIAFDVRSTRHLMSSEDVVSYVEGAKFGRYINSRSGGAAIVEFGKTIVDDDDKLQKAVRLHRIDGSNIQPLSQFEESAWEEALEPIWAAAWDAEFAKADPYITRSLALVTGQLLPIWSKLPATKAQVRRLKAPDGRRWLGRLLDPLEIPGLKASLGLTDIASELNDGATVIKLIMDDNAEVAIDGEMFLRRTRVMNNWRLEVVNGREHMSELKLLGAYVDIINYTPRVFIRVEDDATLTKVLKKWPALELTDRRKSA